MAIVFASNQVAARQTTNGTTGATTFTLPSPTTNGNALVVVLSQGLTIGIPEWTFLDTYGNVFTRVAFKNVNSIPTLVYVATNIVGGASHQVTPVYPFPFVVDVVAWIGEFSGIPDNSIILDAENSNFDSGPSTTHQTGLINTNYASNLVLAIGNGGSFIADSGTVTVASGYTVGATLRNNLGGFGMFHVGFKILTAIGTEDPVYTTANSVAASAGYTVALSPVARGLSRIRFSLLALGQKQNILLSAVGLRLATTATVSGVLHTFPGSANPAQPIRIAVTASATKVGLVPASPAQATIRIHVDASGFFVGAKPKSGQAVTVRLAARATGRRVGFQSSLVAIGGQGSFTGYSSLDGTLLPVLLVLDANLRPRNLDAAATCRVVATDGLLTGVVAASVPLDEGVIADASNTEPVVYTSANHGLTSGVCVTVTGVLGNLGANAIGVVTALDANTFSVSPSAGSGDYTGGGRWLVTGLHRYTLDTTTRAGFEAASSYSLRGRDPVDGAVSPDQKTFVVM